MPLSRLRRRNIFTPPPGKVAIRLGSPRWLVPVMLFFFLAGLVWIVTWYLTESRLPIADIGWWNLIIGFSLIMVGFGFATRWK